jgi:periplasmic protein TonB
VYPIKAVIILAIYCSPLKTHFMWYTESNKDEILNADYLDILYQGHNKKYGGYELRKNYSRRMLMSLFLLFIGGILAGGYGLLFAGSSVETAPDTRPYKLTDIHPNITPPRITPPPATPHHEHTASQNTKPPIISDDDKVTDKEKPAHNENITNPGPATTEGDAGPVTGSGPARDTVAGDGPVAAPPAVPVRIYAEVMPSPQYSLSEYLAKNMHFPDRAREAGVQGRVVLRFVINEDGSITDISIVRGIGAGCDEEALRVVSAMPAWKPGMQNGTPVRIAFTLPIVFKLD